jgi:hypothetical protein
MLVINRRNLILKNNSVYSSQGEDNIQDFVSANLPEKIHKAKMPFIQKDREKIKIQDEFSHHDETSVQMILETEVQNGLPQINNISDLHYYEEQNFLKLDNLIQKQKGNARTNHSVYSTNSKQNQPQN